MNRPEPWVLVETGSKLVAEECMFDNEGIIPGGSIMATSEGVSQNPDDIKLSLNMRSVVSNFMHSLSMAMYIHLPLGASWQRAQRHKFDSSQAI